VGDTNEDDQLTANAGGTVLGQNWAVKVAGTWAAPAVLAAVVFLLMWLGDPSDPNVRVATAFAEILLGVTVGVAYTSKRVEDWKVIAEERKAEVDRMAEEKREVAALQKSRSSAGKGR
jgi:hypothetical protein